MKIVVRDDDYGSNKNLQNVEDGNFFVVLQSRIANCYAVLCSWTLTTVFQLLHHASMSVIKTFL